MVRDFQQLGSHIQHIPRNWQVLIPQDSMFFFIKLYKGVLFCFTGFFSFFTIKPIISPCQSKIILVIFWKVTLGFLDNFPYDNFLYFRKLYLKNKQTRLSGGTNSATDELTLLESKGSTLPRRTAASGLGGWGRLGVTAFRSAASVGVISLSGTPDPWVQALHVSSGMFKSLSFVHLAIACKYLP